jgi:seryl-tRNA synthetase
MIDIQRIRDDIPAYKKVCEYKKKPIDVDKLILLDDKRKELQLQIDQTKFQQKELAAAQDYEGAKKLKEQIQEVQ